MRRSWLLALTLLACVKTPPAIAPASFAIARPAAPWPSELAQCAIEQGWEQMCAPSFDIRDDKGVVRARVERATYTHVRWMAWPLLGAVRDASVEATAGGLRVVGRASIEGQDFLVRHAIELAGPSARIPAGSRVSILGTTGAKLVIEAPTGLANPATVEAAISCDSFGGASVEAMPSGPPYARPRARSIALHASASGPRVFSFQPREDSAWVWIERQGARVHVVGGHHPWRRFADRTSFVFDGWVAAEDVHKVDSIDAVWDSGCDAVDLKDSCPRAFAAHDAIVRASPNGPPVATLVHGAYVVPLEQKDGFIAFHLPNDEIVAPKGSRFWIAQPDLQIGCVGVPMEDGCPCVP